MLILRKIWLLPSYLKFPIGNRKTVFCYITLDFTDIILKINRRRDPSVQSPEHNDQALIFCLRNEFLCGSQLARSLEKWMDCVAVSIPAVCVPSSNPAWTSFAFIISGWTKYQSCTGVSLCFFLSVCLSPLFLEASYGTQNKHIVCHNDIPTAPSSVEGPMTRLQKYYRKDSESEEVGVIWV